ncbi:MAG: alanine racemase [delta proteobacterium ML8_F1]|nr:MAG: alanine racemase [delta proteobacterium ML8_F1]
MDYIKENLKEIKDNIRTVCEKQGRDPESVTLIAVTKTIDEAVVNESLKLGIRDIGENKVQEIERKYPAISKGVKWHLIGHLQRNKVKYVIDKVAMIHSVDSLRLAQEIDKRAEGIGLVMDVLLQLNIAREESKFGLDMEELYRLIEDLSRLGHIRVRGLMTMAPFVENPEEVRWVFRKMKDIFEDLKLRDFENIDMEYLSMGMTNDYLVALEEGANMLRIGTGIYGPRDYSK